ncbi:MAG TPA: c-type cytochrome [Polyangia bacterium]
MKLIMEPLRLRSSALLLALAAIGPGCRHGRSASRSAGSTGETSFLDTVVDPEPPMTAELAAHGHELFMKDCVACHGPRGDGKGYGAPFLTPPPRDFTSANFRLRTTPSGSLPTDSDLYRTISRGVGGTAMPAWRWFLPAPRDRWALVAYVKTLSERWKNEKPEAPLAFGDPPRAVDTPPSIARGQEVYKTSGCFNCHGEDGMGDGPAALTLKDESGIPITARDFTNPARFKGGWNDREIVRTFLTGLDGTPMPSFRGAIPDADIWSLAAYVKSLGHLNPLKDALSHGSGQFEKSGSSNRARLGAPDAKIALLERGWHYEPNEIHAKAGQVVEVTLTVTDNGLGAGHGFSIDGMDERTFLNGSMVGAPKSVKFRVGRAGHYPFHCVTQCSTGYLHPNMTGTLIVD